MLPSGVVRSRWGPKVSNRLASDDEAMNRLKCVMTKLKKKLKTKHRRNCNQTHLCNRTTVSLTQRYNTTLWHSQDWAGSCHTQAGGAVRGWK